MIYSKFNITKITSGLELATLFCFFCLCFAFTGICLSLINLLNIGGRNLIITQLLIQNIFIFISPILLTAFLLSKKPFTYLWLKNCGNLKYYLFAVAIYVISMPALNWITEWNNAVHLPDSMYGLESTLRELENLAQETTNSIITNSNLFQLLINILLIGVLTGIGEEFFFRGGIQNILYRKPMNHHLAILITAIIFSAVHFQFFGFVPRLLLGMFFGYLLIWGKSLWIPVFAHALNNSCYVINEYICSSLQCQQKFISTIGSSENAPYLAAISGAATILLILFRKKICD